MGDTPSTDASSNDAKVFGGDDAKRMEALKFVDSLQELRHPLRLSFIVSHRNELVGIRIQRQCDGLIKRAQERPGLFRVRGGRSRVERRVSADLFEQCTDFHITSGQ
jgi:hypothetical protein